MPNIRIEWVPIQVMNLGLFGFDHMQLVYQQGVGDDFSDQENWLVLEGGFTINAQGQSELIVYGASGALPLKWANGDDDGPLTGQALIDEIGTPYSRGSRIVPTLDPFNAWQVMANYGSEIHENQVPYVAHAIPGTAIPVINSSSVIASLLHTIDVDIRLVFPSGMRYSPGHTTLVGTTGDDVLKIEDNFLTLVGGQGADEFFGKDSAFSQRYYGGQGNDVFHHSKGFKIFHGGDPFRPYDGDGLDTLDLTGINATIIKRNSEHIDHIFPHLIVQAGGMNAWLLSIERFVWNDSTDKIFLQDGLQILDERIYFNLKKESSLSGEDYGDTVDFTDIGGGVLINVLDDDTLLASRIENEEGRNGLQIEDAEYIIGSSQDDRIYITSNMRGADGGNGNDIIDGRLGSAAAGTGPEGNPVELTGGAGDDTLVGASGESTLIGGEGADRFVLGAMSSDSGETGPTEMVIADADADDRLFIPYNFLDNSGGDFDGSLLFPVLGAFGTYDDLMDGQTLLFQWRTQEQFIYEQNEPEGVIDFYGQIIYRMDGSDLLIQVLQAEPIEILDPESSTVTATLLSFDFTTLSTIRITDFDRGDLGLVSHDLGTPDLPPIGQPARRPSIPTGTQPFRP